MGGVPSIPGEHLRSVCTGARRDSRNPKLGKCSPTISLAEAKSVVSDVFKSLGQTVELSAESGSHRPESSKRKLEAF